jgi:hypothetical protein
VQERVPGSRTLLEGGSSRDALCSGPVSMTAGHTLSTLLKYRIQYLEDAGELSEGVRCSLGLSGVEQPEVQPLPEARAYIEQVHVREARKCHIVFRLHHVSC